ncbi:MAG: hypothetical protein HY685_05820 [Chloroflexi bacterium]|nr:hypothetical protein [Chloroflexota bacterium]
MKTEVRLAITRRLTFAGGHSFGPSGPYERLVGRAEFALDPEDPTNRNVVDLDKAPRNGRGLVEFAADLDILKPVALDRGNSRILYDVCNRGNRTALTGFNVAPPALDPSTLAHAGNGFLLRQGYTVVWSGWQGDLLPLEGLLTADLPEALVNGRRLQGRVRQEFVVDQEGIYSLPLSGSPTARCQESVDLDTSHAVFTRREREADPRQPLSPNEWAFAQAEKDPRTGQVKVTSFPSHCYVKAGIRPGWIYELIYDTAGSPVTGLGPVGIRDLLSVLRHEAWDAAGEPNPLAGFVEKVYGYGASLSARALRQFVYDGYNRDPLGRRVFDAVYPHLSGSGRLFANVRFAQIGRFPRQHEEHQWPSERYPFAYSAVPDPFTGKVDSVLKDPPSDPLVVHTHTSSEYWQRHASLGHTDPRTGDDLGIPGTVRMFFIAGAQHGGALAPLEDVGQQSPNTMTTSPFLRASLVLMDRWASEGKAPPSSRLPRRGDETLAAPEAVLACFPRVPGVRLPTAPSHLPRYDYGPEFDDGLVTEHPPKAPPGQEYPVQVPQVDADGNEIAGLRSPEIETPVGTHTGWNLRKAGFAEGELYSLTGSFIPFARTRAEREATGDPRLSIEERYRTHAGYVRAVARATERLVAEGLLLQEDADRYVEAAMKRNPLDRAVPLRPLLLGQT